MHYKNGREAKNGDKVALINDWCSVIGILYDAKPGNDYCNGKLALISSGDVCPNLKECIHLDDVKSALTKSEWPSMDPYRIDTASIPSDPRPNAVPIERCSDAYSVNGAARAAESDQVARYRERPASYPDASRGPSGQGGL